LGNWFAANEQIETALELDPNSVDVLRNYGYVLEVQGNYSGAVEAYRDALQQNPSLAHLYLAMGRNYQALGNFTRAIEAYESATESDPASVAAFDRLGWTYLLQGDYVEAQGYLEQALEIDPNYSRALGHLGSLYFQRRNYEDAIPTLEQAIRYGEGESRLRVVRFRITSEPLGQPATEPGGREVAQGVFVHPDQINYPMRAMLSGEETFSTVQGYVRFYPLDGRYVLRLEGLPPSPPNEVYVGWFEPLLTPEKETVRTEPLVPDTEGNVELNGTTGAVTGPPIENYYTLALCYYFLDQCEDAYPHIEVALRIDPEDANALQTLQLCGQ
jgi:tetratricopeptide (TPR) repeat protein